MKEQVVSFIEKPMYSLVHKNPKNKVDCYLHLFPEGGSIKKNLTPEAWDWNWRADMNFAARFLTKKDMAAFVQKYIHKNLANSPIESLKSFCKVYDAEPCLIKGDRLRLVLL